MNLLAEKQTIKAVADPVDMNTAAITGARIGLSQADRCAIVLAMGASTAAVVQFTVRQHNAASAGTSKDLVNANPYFKKVGAATSYTKVVPAVAAALVDVSTDFAASAGILILEVRGEDLDVNGGFTHVSVDVADSTAAKLLSGLYILSDVRFVPAYSLVI